MMKYKCMGGVALFLAAAVLLTACGGSTGGTNASPVEQSGIRVVSVLPDVTPVDVDTTESATVFADTFSNRDLAGTWDAGSAVRITLNGTSISSESGAVTVSGSTATITAAGTYLLSGTLEDGTVIVDAGKEDKVQIVLDGVAIHSAAFAAIYVRQADKVFLTLAAGTENTLSNGGTFEAMDDNNVDGVIFSKDDLTLNGSGKLTVTSPGKHGIVCKDDLVITGGTYEVTAASHALSGKDSVSVADGVFALTAGKDGIHSENSEDAGRGNVYLAGGTLAITADSDGVSASGTLQIDGGTFDITAHEGMEGTYIRVNDGVINIDAADDGINAARKSSAYTPTIEINGGEITVTVGPGDTDCVDSNGDLIITGGVLNVTGNSTFDCDGNVTFTGGTVIVNGQQVDTIPNQRMGGRGGMGRNFDGDIGQGGNFNPGVGRRNLGSLNGNPPSDETLENGVREGRGKRGGERLPDESGNADSGELPVGRSGRGRSARPDQAAIPDAVTAPTRTAQAV